MDFWSTYIGFLLVAGGVILVGWWISKQWFRNRFIAFGTQQAHALEKLARDLPLEDRSTLPMRSGEEFVYLMKDVTLHETRAGARTSPRSFGAATFRVGKGMYLTGGGGSSYSPPPEDEMRIIDSGSATFTNKRVVFVGSKQTREWDFAKVLGATPMDGGGVLIAVSSRQKMSGIQSNSPKTVMPWVMFQVAQLVAEEGFDAAREPLQQAARDAREQVEFVRNCPTVSRSEIVEFTDEQQERTRREEKKKESISEPVVNDSLTRETPDRRGKKGQTTRELEVVGEFFYPDSFEALRKEFGTRGDSEHIVEAELRCDPDNPHSESGYAVAVYVRGHQVGHIPEALAPDVYEVVEAKGGTLSLGARVWLDDEDNRPGKSSVQLFLDSRLEL